MKQCPHCGKEQSDNNIYCLYCGKSMIELRQPKEPDPVKEPIPPEEPTPPSEQPPLSPPYVHVDPPKKRSRLPLLGAVLAVFLIGGAVGIAVGHGSGGSGREAQTVETSQESAKEPLLITESDMTETSELPDETEESTVPLTEAAESEAPVVSESVEPSPEPVESETPAVSESVTPSEEPAPANTVAISAVTATSALSEYNMTHSASRICDGNLSTAWVEGVDGNGIGESVTITFDGSCLEINAGYQKSSDLYEKNARPSELLLTFSDGTTETVWLEDVNATQTIVLSQARETSSVTLTIQSVYTGWKYEDTVISEVAFF
ncbi:MAG: zinc-ribbon domain-containing protein [Oscillospiraceae bacterium]|nr:zinc-ribbon domain-containing protein [Oscillospiraceae bacterium]